MVPEKSSSLFKDLTGSYDFNIFHFPDNILLELDLQPDDYLSYDDVDDADDSDNSYNGFNNPILDKDWDQMSMAAASLARAERVSS